MACRSPCGYLHGSEREPTVKRQSVCVTFWYNRHLFSGPREVLSGPV